MTTTVDRPRALLAKLLIVEDEEDVSNSIKRYFIKVGPQKGMIFDIRVAENLKSALEQIELFQPHVAIIDLRIPEKDGDKPSNLSGIDLIGKDMWLGKIIYSSQPLARIGGELLESGADYYIEKPSTLDFIFSATASVFRRVILAHDYGETEVASDDEYRFRIGRLDISSHKISLDNGQEIRLTPTEFATVKYIIDNRGMNEDEFFEKVVEMSRHSNVRLLENTIYRLRKKISKDFILRRDDGSYFID